MSESRDQPPWWAWGCTASSTAADLRNLARFNLLAIGWAIAFVLAATGIRKGSIVSLALGIAAAVAVLAVGAVALLAYRRFLREADELQRRIQLEAIALGFGGGIAFALGYRLFELLGAPPLGVTDVVTAFIALWAVGQILATRRYR